MTGQDVIDVEATETTETTETVVSGGFDMANANPQAALDSAAVIVQHMAAKCTGPQFIANIQGRSYPKVEWWTTVGASLGLFPVEISSIRHDYDSGGYYYEAVVEVRHNGTIVTRASAICSTDESSWGNRDEYAVKSMATTRATGKAYRIGLSSLAVMAGLEPTPSDEIPPQGFGNRSTGRTAVPRTIARVEPEPHEDPAFAAARSSGLRALTTVFSHIEDKKEHADAKHAFVVENFPALDGVPGSDYTLENWNDIITLAQEPSAQAADGEERA